VRLLRRLTGHGLTIFIIDHDMQLVSQVADHISVLNFGRRIADGDKEVRIFGELHPNRAHVEVLSGFSGHADRDELLANIATRLTRHPDHPHSAAAKTRSRAARRPWQPAAPTATATTEP